MDSTSARIRAFIESEFGVPSGMQLGDEDSLLTNGLVDSMGVLSLVEFIEAEFGLAIADTDLVAENFESIAAMRDFVASRLGTPSVS